MASNQIPEDVRERAERVVVKQLCSQTPACKEHRDDAREAVSAIAPLFIEWARKDQAKADVQIAEFWRSQLTARAESAEERERALIAGVREAICALDLVDVHQYELGSGSVGDIARTLSGDGSKILVEDHHAGTAPRSAGLSTARANAVRNYLLTKGLAASRVEASGGRASRPGCEGTAGVEIHVLPG